MPTLKVKKSTKPPASLAVLAADIDDEDLPPRGKSEPMDDEEDEEPMGMGMDSEMGDEGDDEADLDDEVFAENIVAAFPELEGNTERIDAFKAAIEACVRKDRAGEYEKEV